MTTATDRDTELKRVKMYPDVIRMPLEDARVCLDCDTIHNGDSCPVCASATFFVLSSVIGRLAQNTWFPKPVARAQDSGHPLLISNPRVLRSVGGR